MTTTGSALILLNQLLSLTTPTPTPLPFSPLSVSPSPYNAPPTMLPTAPPTITSTPFPTPTLSSPSFLFSHEFETRYLLGFFIVIFIFIAKTLLAIYRFISRMVLLKTLKPNMTYFSSFHTVLRTGSFKGK